MGDRSSRTTEPFQNMDLLELTKKPIVNVSVDDIEEYDPLDDEWTAPGFASGSNVAAEPTRARTPTVHDPMTTGLLAEVARRKPTIELDSETLATALKASGRNED
jgi:hypothetical protein